MEVISCSPGGPSPVNSNSALSQASNNNSTSNNNNKHSSNSNNNVVPPNNVANSSNLIVSNGSSSNSNALAVTPKLEHSPPEHFERQTVLMWGAASNNNNSSTNRSPTATPTSNGLYAESNHMKLANQIVMSPNEHQSHHHQQSQQSNVHLKWNENNTKEIPVSGVPIYQIHSHQQESTGVDTSSMYAQVSHSPHLPHHSSSANTGGHIVSPDQSGLHHSPQNHHQSVLQQSTQQHQTVGSSCEVWSPAYSQYQYFTYHHAPQHANTQ